MNSYMNAQISNMIDIVKTFEQSCELAALQDDNKISFHEKRTLAKIQTASKTFRKNLEQID